MRIIGVLCLLSTSCGGGSSDMVATEMDGVERPPSPIATATVSGAPPVPPTPSMTAVPIPAGRYVASPPPSRRFDSSGRLIGMHGVAYNPCADTPCVETESAPDTPELRAQTSIAWPKGGR